MSLYNKIGRQTILVGPFACPTKITYWVNLHNLFSTLFLSFYLHNAIIYDLTQIFIYPIRFTHFLKAYTFVLIILIKQVCMHQGAQYQFQWHHSYIYVLSVTARNRKVMQKKLILRLLFYVGLLMSIPDNYFLNIKFHTVVVFRWKTV